MRTNGSPEHISHFHQLAVLAGATTLGDPPQYLFSAEQLTRFAEFLAPNAAFLARLADYAEKVGHKTTLTV